MAELPDPLEGTMQWMNPDGQFVGPLKAEDGAPCFIVYPNGNCVPIEFFY